MKIIKTIYILFFAITSFAQNHNDHFSIHNYRNDIVLDVNSQQNASSILSDYGMVNNSRGNTPYGFQAQEWDDILGVYYFPSRIYSPYERRFLQPDPKSQYASPYLFVGADPVNWVDRDGNAGKPLVLYALETRKDTRNVESEIVENLSRDIDAHYMSLPDFMNGKFKAMMPEWNGNVFIHSHASKDGGIITERYTNKELVRTNPDAISLIKHSPEGEMSVVADNTVFSKNLARLSKETKVPVKNIVVGGCEGKAASLNIGGQFAHHAEEMGIPHDFSTYGLQPNYLATYSANPLPQTKAGPIRSEYSFRVHNKLADPKKTQFYGKKRSGKIVKAVNELGEESGVLDYQGIGEMMNARIPDSVSGYFCVARFY